MARRGIFAGNVLFSGQSNNVGISSSSVPVVNRVVLGDIDAMGTANPLLVFGTESSFSSLEISGGDLLQSNGQPVQIEGVSQITALDGVKSDGALVLSPTIMTDFINPDGDPVTIPIN